MKSEYHFAGLYDLRLKLSQLSELVHINEYLYSEIENDNRKAERKYSITSIPETVTARLRWKSLHRASERNRRIPGTGIQADRILGRQF